MAQGATIYSFDIELADVDRGVYASLNLRVARHPSEAADYLLTRVIAYCLEYTDGISFSKGLAEPDEPALTVRDLAGDLKLWVEVGAPNAERLHKASKLSPRVAVYTHRDPALVVRALAGERIHRVEAIELYAIDRLLLRALAGRLERRTTFALSVTDQQLYVQIDGTTVGGAVTRHPLQ